VRERRELEALDIRLLDYLPNFAWFASLPATPELLTQLEALPFHRASIEIEPEDKLSPCLRQGVGEWARNPDGTVNVIIHLFRDVPLSEGYPLIALYGGQVSKELPLLQALQAVIPEERIPTLAQELKVQWLDQVPPPPTTDNDGIRAAIGVDWVQTAPYELSGEGVVIGEWDGGWADPTHPDLAGRVAIGDPGCEEIFCEIAEHPTHVAGTVVGNGALSAEAGGEPRQ
jgi:hypothetical protein